MASLHLPLLVLLALHAAQSCTYFCKNEETNTYHCCDTGSTANSTTTSSAGAGGSNPLGNPTNPTNPGSAGDPAGGGEASAGSEGGVGTVLVTEHGPEDGAKYNESSGCVYYCAYGGSVYCCDDGSLTMPEDHDPHTGRCPTEQEQVCKEDTVYLSLKAAKVGRTLSGAPELSRAGDDSVRCASDGYCSEDEKCCTSVCHKRHVCLKALHTDKGKP